MTALQRTRSFIPACILLLAAVAAPQATEAQSSGPEAARAEATVVFLVRHAEKAEAPADDPPLTAEGESRASTLARLLDDAALDAVWSTDFARTRDTAAPLAEGESLEVELYDPRDLAGFAATLRERGGRALVVGHSNTTPELVRSLGGEPGPPIDEADEYDRLYVLTLMPGGETVTSLLRFGTPYTGG